VLKYLDDLSEAAAIIGAVNTVVNNDGRLWGDNTDGKGFLASLVEAGVAIRGANAVVLGAGGAARSIAVELALAGAASVTVVNRDQGRGEGLARLVADRTPAKASFLPWTGAVAIPGGTDILVNATSVGLFPDVDARPDIDYDGIAKSMTVSDVIFNDPNTVFLREAEKRGARTVNGFGMLVNQGALNFKLWTGVEAPREVMTATLRKEFGL
jgi:shikimate dehydrogenase